MATPAQTEFAARLHEERELSFDTESFEALSVEDASATIDVLLSEVESGPITEEQQTRIAELLALVGPRNDGQEWQIPSDRGRAAAFIRSLEKWHRGKVYGERKDAARAKLAEQGVTCEPARETHYDDPQVVENTEDEIPF